ncbi:MAG: aminotransferase class V-fold PLP-dependent enzyme [Alphaproteobacteria bacterium]|nr:aminotransferase class V-fold PLP-dependent enzyme [Alphaproteobacteria bacterium]
MPLDSKYWDAIAAQFDMTREIVPFENGMWGMMPRSVLEAYRRKTEMVNRRNSFYARRQFDADLEKVRGRAARDLGVALEEIAFTRGATESLMTLINGYNRLKPGDAVLYADLDYDSTQAAFDWLGVHRGVDVVRIALSEPATHQNLIDTYEAALKAHPKVRLMLLTHVSHRTGLVLPVPEIVAMARKRGVDVIVDSAHAWGQLDFKLDDLKADFVALTCQKWIGAPVGTGLMYVRRSRIGDIDAAIGNGGFAQADIRARIHTGTSNFAAFLALDDALDFHETIGAPVKEARLRHLRDRWAEELRGRIEILTPSDPRLTSGITSFRLHGHTSHAQNIADAETLLKRFNIFTVERSGVASGSCIRVTCAVFTREAEVDRLVEALRTMAG